MSIWEFVYSHTAHVRGENGLAFQNPYQKYVMYIIIIIKIPGDSAYPYPQSSARWISEEGQGDKS